MDGYFYTEKLQRVELSFDSFEIVKEIDDEHILVNQLNVEGPAQIVDKTDFFKNRLRPRKS